MVVLFVWIGAVVVAGVVLGFCVYELAWKSRRLRADLGTLTALRGDLAAMQREVAAVQLRALEARAPETQA